MFANIQYDKAKSIKLKIIFHLCSLCHEFNTVRLSSCLVNSVTLPSCTKDVFCTNNQDLLTNFLSPSNAAQKSYFVPILIKCSKLNLAVVRTVWLCQFLH